MTKPRKAPKARTAQPRPRSEGEAVQRPFAKLAPDATAKKRPARAKPERPVAPPEALPDDRSERLRFAQLMRGVKPLRDGARRIPTTLDALDDPAEDREPARGRTGSPEAAQDKSARARLEAFVAEGIRFEVIDDGESLEGRRLDVDPREIRKLRQLRYALDGTLDLHGLDAAEARAKVESFLRRRRLQGDRAVLIVHGKGKHSPRGQAVLRGEIAAWLSQGRAQRDVAAFASVHDRDGGTGAVCILLAR